MKYCSTCQEEFADKFSFCPVDGTPLNGFVAQAAIPAVNETEQTVPALPPSNESFTENTAASANDDNEYHLTIIEEESILRRLAQEVRSVAHDYQLTWPEFQRDPIGFTRRSATAYSLLVWRFFSTPNTAIATVTALFLVIGSIISIVALDRYRAARNPLLAARLEGERAELLDLTDIPAEQPEVEKGTAGTNKGTGGGSKPKQEKPGGGGGGGREQQQPANFGKTPQASLTVPPVVAPNPELPKLKNPALPVPYSLDADPKLIKVDTRPIPYGDPKSTSTVASNGPGTGGGFGSGSGLGIGPGEGGGLGPGRGGNVGGGDRHEGGGGEGGGGGGGVDYNKVFSPREVTQKARILSKTEPPYTEEARKNQISGTVVLQVVLSSSGQVTNIRAVSGLPYGLTEKAIAAARQIRFTPAMKDGRAVSQYTRIEYNFNLY